MNNVPDSFIKQIKKITLPDEAIFAQEITRAQALLTHRNIPQEKQNMVGKELLYLFKAMYWGKIANNLPIPPFFMQSFNVACQQLAFYCELKSAELYLGTILDETDYERIITVLEELSTTKLSNSRPHDQGDLYNPDKINKQFSISDDGLLDVVDKKIENNRSRKNIVVFAALYEELKRIFGDGFINKLPFELEWTYDTLESLGIPYWRTPLNKDYNLIAITPDSMGLTETAIVATAAFDAFKPVLSAMLGICAGRYDEKVLLGHLIVPTQTFHHQFGAITGDKLESKTKTAYELEPEIRAETVSQSFYTAAQIVNDNKCFEIWMNDQHPESLRPSAKCKCHIGPLACSDFVVKWDKLIENAVKMDRKVLGVDMESYAFLRAARRCGHENDVFIVKCVTDYADKDKDDKIREWAQVASARFFYLMLLLWLDETHRTTYWNKLINLKVGT